MAGSAARAGERSSALGCSVAARHPLDSRAAGAPRGPILSFVTLASRASVLSIARARSSQTSLDKWYGESPSTHHAACGRPARAEARSAVAGLLFARGATLIDLRALESSRTGPDRALFLPSGLLDPADVPSYLNGELAGE